MTRKVRVNECGHPERKHVAKGMCNACRLRVRYATDPKRYREQVRVWREDNPERNREQKRAYYEANREAVCERQRAYYEAKKGKSAQ